MKGGGEHGCGGDNGEFYSRTNREGDPPTGRIPHLTDGTSLGSKEMSYLSGQRKFLPSVWGGAGWLGLAALLLMASPAARGAGPTLQPTVVWVPEEWHTGGAYTAIQAGPDGRVYLGTTFYKGFARLVALPPGGREFQLIADMGAATGDRTLGPDAQAKIHTKPAVAPDGRVYFGTKSGEPAEKAAAGTYPGGHFLVYGPQTGGGTEPGELNATPD